MTPMAKAAMLESTVSMFLPMLRAMAYRRLNSVDDAEDVVQDALLLAHRKLHQFRGDSKMSTWLWRIVANCVSMEFRKRRVERVSPDEEEFVLSSLPDTRPDAHNALCEAAKRRVLNDAIEKLSPVLRETVQLRLDGFTHDEIAAKLKCPVGTIKARTLRATRRVTFYAQRAVA